MNDTVDDTPNSAVGDTADATMEDTEAAAMALTTKAAESRLSALPRELRDMIYDNLAATEERTILGRRLIEQRKKDEVTGRDFLRSLTACVALHSLSMTCRQLRDEFQPLHASAPEPNYAFIVNNFDLEQIKISATACKPMWPSDYGWDIVSHFSIRFQLDSDVVVSAENLQDYVVCGMAETLREWRWVDDRWGVLIATVMMAYSRNFKPTVDEENMGPRDWHAARAYHNWAGGWTNWGSKETSDRVPKATIAATYRDVATGFIDEKKSMTAAQARCVHFSIFNVLDEICHALDISLGDQLTEVSHRGWIGDVLWMREYIWKPLGEYAKPRRR